MMTESVVSCASAPLPSKVIPLELRRMLFAASVAPIVTAVLMTEVSPSRVVELAPRAILVVPTVIELFAKLALAIDEPVERRVPLLSGKFSARSAVGSTTLRVVSKSFAVEPSKTMPVELSRMLLAAFC